MNNYLFWISTSSISGSLIYFIYYNKRYKYHRHIGFINLGTFIGLAYGITRAYIDHPISSYLVKL